MIFPDGKIFLPINDIVSGSAVVQFKKNSFAFKQVTQEASILADARIRVCQGTRTGGIARTYGARIGQSPQDFFWTALSCAGFMVGASTRFLATALHQKVFFCSQVNACNHATAAIFGEMLCRCQYLFCCSGLFLSEVFSFALFGAGILCLSRHQLCLCNLQKQKIENATAEVCAEDSFAIRLRIDRRPLQLASKYLITNSSYRLQ